MKIAFISMIREPWGGSEELWYETALYALDQGDTVLHSAFKFSQLHPKKVMLQKRGAKFFFRRGITGTNLPKVVWSLQLIINFLKKVLKNPFTSLFQAKPDIVVYTGTAYSISKEKYLLPFLDKTNASLYILVQLNYESIIPLSPKESDITRKYYSQAKKVFFVSEKNKRIAEIQLGKSVNNAVVVRNPVNLKLETQSRFPDMTNPIHLAMVGNLVIKHKGQDIALGTLAREVWKNRDFTLNIYGRGPDETHLKNLVSSYELQNKVVFHGHVKDIRDIWQKNHILLMPSRMEGMPLAVVEAMLCYRPVIATSVGGIPEWIENQKEGFLAETPTIESLSQTLEIAWQNRYRWQEMGLLARDKALKLYNPDPGKTFYNLITSSM